MNPETHPTIVLIGGPITMDDGTEMDSRQDIAGDDGCTVLTKSLATSWLWWEIAASLVQRMLASASQDGYALIIGPRSVTTLNHDETFKQTRLSGLLSGGTETLAIDRTTTEFPDGQARWRFLNGNAWYLKDLGTGPNRPTVIVDTCPTFAAHPIAYPGFEDRRLLASGSVLVIPHTAQADRFARGYAKWLVEGRPAPRVGDGVRPSQAAQGPIHYAQPIPIGAEFGVTGLVRNGRWTDPVDLEAARSLLHSRFDLRLGLWDLADNPVLRATLLNTVPTPQAPSTSTALPRASAQRAEALVKKKDEQRARAEPRLAAVARALQPLTTCGWHAYRLASFQLPLTEPMERWPGEIPEPMLSVWLYVGRGWTIATVMTPMYNDVDVAACLSRPHYRRSIEGISGPMPAGSSTGAQIWRIDRGWMDTQTNWSGVAEEIQEYTPQWIEALDDLARQCREVLASRAAKPGAE